MNLTDLLLVTQGLWAVIAFFGGMLLKDFYSRLGKLETASILRGERLSDMEGQVRGVHERLDRIEKKVDQLLQRG